MRERIVYHIYTYFYSFCFSFSFLMSKVFSLYSFVFEELLLNVRVVTNYFSFPSLERAFLFLREGQFHWMQNIQLTVLFLNHLKNFYLFLLVLIAPDKNFSVTQIGVTLQVIHSIVWMLSRLFFVFSFWKLMMCLGVGVFGCILLSCSCDLLSFLKVKICVFLCTGLCFANLENFFQVLFHKVVFQSYSHLFSLQNFSDMNIRSFFFYSLTGLRFYSAFIPSICFTYVFQIEKILLICLQFTNYFLCYLHSTIEPIPNGYFFLLLYLFFCSVVSIWYFLQEKITSMSSLWFSIFSPIPREFIIDH